MDGRQVDGTVGDRALDQEIASALGIEPSPEFMARVRTRVAAEQQLSRRRVSWMVIPAAAIGIAVLAAFSTMEPPAGRVAPLPFDAAASPVTALAPAVPPAQEVAAEVNAGAGGVARRATSRAVRLQEPAVTSVPFEEVIISDDERRGFLVLMAALRANTMPPVREARVALGTPPLEVQPLTMQPLQMTRID